MSCYEWETATITLPSAAVAPLKKALREHTNDFHARVRKEAVRLHKKMGTRSTAKYRKALFEAERASWDRPGPRSVSNSFYANWGAPPKPSTQTPDDMVSNAAFEVLWTVLHFAERGEKTLHVPTVADVEQVAPRPTNRTNHFPIRTHRGGTEGGITFDGRTVTWNVMENNHAVENAHEAPLAAVFFNYLDSVKWTRGTGGYGTGNNEYNREDDAPGGGGNYTTFSYGPLGDTVRGHITGIGTYR